MVLGLESLVLAVAEFHHQQEEYQDYLHEEDWAVRPFLFEDYQLTRIGELAINRLTYPVHCDAQQHNDCIQRLHSSTHRQDL